MPEMKALCTTDAVPEGGGLRLVVDDIGAVAVFRVGAEYFVIDDTCTHGSASLSEGEVIGTHVQCPYHFGTFDLRTGEPIDPPCTTPVATYTTEVRGNMLYISMT